jgi:hypothetical protein
MLGTSTSSQDEPEYPNILGMLQEFCVCCARSALEVYFYQVHRSGAEPEGSILKPREHHTIVNVSFVVSLTIANVSFVPYPTIANV